VPKPAADTEPPKPIFSFGRFLICIAFAAFVQIAIALSASVHEELGNMAWSKTYVKNAEVFYWPGMRLFWWITPSPAPFNVGYGFLGMLFLLVLYSVAFGIIASVLLGLAHRLIRRFRSRSNLSDM
jgi:hypothetical protein